MVVEALETRSMLAASPFVPGKLNQAVNFTQYPAPVLDMGDPTDNHLDLGANFTIENWVKFDALPDAGEGYSFVSKDEGRAVPGFPNPNKWIFGYGNFSYAANKTFFHVTNQGGGGVWIASNPWTPQLDTWYHVAVVKSTSTTTGAQTYRFYLNGVQNGLVTATYTVPDVDAPLQIGRAEYDPGHPAQPAIPGDSSAEPPIPAQDAIEEVAPSGFWMIGSIDDVRIWNTARSLSQVSTNYTKELIGTESGLVGYWKLNELTGASADDATSYDTTGTYLDPTGLEVDALHSKPGAKATLYLDFNGDYLKEAFNGDSPKIIKPYDTDDDITTFNEEEKADINDIWAIVSEVYAPFDIDVTTEVPSSYKSGFAARIDIGDVNSWTDYPPSLGIGFEDGFTSNDYVDHIAFTWNRYYVEDEDGNRIIDPYTGYEVTAPWTMREVAAGVAHTAGYLFGLKDQSTYGPTGNMIDKYNPGTLQKGPIMGAPFFSDRWVWWNGTTEDAFTYQDDIASLIKTTNGFGFRADEFGNNIANATKVVLTNDPDTNIPTNLTTGVITTLGDVDVLSFTVGAGNLSVLMFNANPGGASVNMLDSDIELRDAAGNILKTATDGTAPSMDFAVPSAGTYYLFIKSHGVYGDIGKYTVKITSAAPVPPSGSISGTVFEDANNDGSKQSGEAGMGSQTVYLDINGNGSLTSGEPTATTASDGTYTFAGLVNDTYKVRVVIPSGYSQTTALSNPVVAGGAAVSGILIGLRQLPSGLISGTVFTDTNNNGAKDSGEAAFAAQTVFLDTNGDGALTSGETSVTSSGDGSYSFSGLAAGTYKVRVVLPSGYTQSTAAANVTLTTGQQTTGILIGLYKPATGGGTTGSLSGVVYGDSNLNGIYDSGDTIGASRTVFLDLDGDNALDTGEKSVLTDSTGKYTFTGLAAGTYHVRRVYPSGYVLSGSPVDVTLAAGQALTGLNIGSKAGTSTGGGGGGGGTTTKGSISGLLFFDNNKNAKFDSGDVIQGGKTVFIDVNGNGKLDAGEASTTTNSSGNYTFSNLSAGTYKIRRVLPAGYKVTTAALNITLSAGQVVTNASIGTTYA